MKKFLALVLALVMTMSLVTISAGAEDFTDAADVNYEEAVEVMTAIEVVGGYADGSFNPTAGLTRGAAAKIICNMILGPTTAEALNADTAPYSDVAVDNVFAGYIAYCAKEGIISGYADGTFRPAAPLTGYAFMKMLLGALGYDANVEGYVGSNWSINVAKRALNVGLDKGLDGSFVGAKALTREEACLYAFNTLKATMVEYKNASTITVGDIVIKNNAVASDVERTTGNHYAGGAETTDGTMQFCEKYFTKLTKTAAQHDEFNRPAYNWKNGKEVVGTYTYAPVVDVVTEAMEADDFATLLDGYTLTVAADRFYNGESDVEWNGLVGATIYDKLESAARNSRIIEFYDINDDDVIDDVVMIQATFGEIAKIKTTAATKNEGEFVTYTLVGGTNGKIYNTTVDSNEKDTLVLHGDFAKGDKVTYVVAQNNFGTAILHIYPLEVVSGALTKITSDGKYTIGGEVYEMAAISGASAPTTVSDKSQDFYVDEFGFLVATKSTSGADYAFVLSTATSYAQNDDGTLDPAYVATLVFPDGSIKKVYTVDTDGEAFNYASSTYLTQDANNSYYGVVSYVVNDDGNYELTKVATATGTGKHNVAVSNLNKNTEKLASTIYANGETLFVYADYKTSDATKLAGTVTTVEGLANVATASSVNGFAVDTDSTPDGVADVVFVYGNVATTSTSKYIYVTGEFSKVGTSSYEYQIFKNGVEDKIVLAAEDATHMTEGLYSTMTISSKTWSADEDAVALSSVVGVKVVGGLLLTSTNGDDYAVTEVALVSSNTNHQATLTSGTIAEVGASVVMYEIDTTDNTCEVVEDMSTAVEGAVYVELNAADDAIAAIYVVHA